MNEPTRSIAAGLAALFTASCGPPIASGELCVYTARSPGQFADELALFTAHHPEITLRCPDADPKSLYCPSRISGAKEDCEEQEAEDWVVLRRSTGLLTQQLIDEGANTGADVVWGLGISHLWHFRERLAILEPYTPKYYDRVHDMVTSSSRAGTLWQSFIEPEVWDLRSYDVPTAVGIDAFAAVFCVNAEKMRAIDEAWGDESMLTWTQVALDPRFVGKVVMPNPTTSGSGFVAIAGLLEHFKRVEGLDEQAAEVLGWKFIQDLDAAVVGYTTTGDGPCELVARADNDLVIGITHDAADMLPHADESASVRGVQRVFPAPDVQRGGGRMLGYDIAASALIDRGLASKPTARIFLDWALSPEAMAKYAVTTPFVAYSVRATPLPAGYPPDLDRLASTQLDFNAISRARSAIQERWLATFCSDPATSGSRCQLAVD